MINMCELFNPEEPIGLQREVSWAAVDPSLGTLNMLVKSNFTRNKLIKSIPEEDYF